MQSELFPQEIVLPKVSMTSFARFVAAPVTQKAKIVRELHTAKHLTSQDRFAPFYGHLVNTLRATHWTTRQIRTFEDAIEGFLRKVSHSVKRSRYQLLSEAYINFWVRHSASYVPIGRAEVDIGGLIIVVNPEIGMQVGNDTQVLKIWLNSPEPSKMHREVISYLMEITSVEHSTWPDQWPRGMWDVQRGRILQNPRPAADFELAIAGQKAHFESVWTALEEDRRRIHVDGI